MPKKDWNPRKRTQVVRTSLGGGILRGLEPEGGEVNRETASF